MDTKLVFLDLSHPERCDTLCLGDGLWGIVETTQNSASENTEKQQESLKHTLCSVLVELKNATCCASKKGRAQSGIRNFFRTIHARWDGPWKWLYIVIKKQKLELVAWNHLEG